LDLNLLIKLMIGKNPKREIAYQFHRRQKSRRHWILTSHLSEQEIVKEFKTFRQEIKTCLFDLVKWVLYNEKKQELRIATMNQYARIFWNNFDFLENARPWETKHHARKHCTESLESKEDYRLLLENLENKKKNVNRTQAEFISILILKEEILRDLFSRVIFQHESPVSIHEQAKSEEKLEVLQVLHENWSHLQNAYDPSILGKRSRSPENLCSQGSF